MTAARNGQAFRVVAIIAAFNEGDVIHHVIRDLVANSVEVYLIDNCSTDDTLAQASPWLGRGLLHIERFPDDSGCSRRSQGKYVWRDLLRRKEQLAAQLGADWYIHADADEFREPIWDGLSLAEGLRRVDGLGYNAVTFDVFNFRPTDDTFVPGADVRRSLRRFEPADQFDALQIKAWKHTGQAIDLVSTGGHEARFADRRVFPFPFVLRHYPIRGASQGRKKIFEERMPRFAAEEREGGWHVQYDALVESSHPLLWDPARLVPYDGAEARRRIVERVHSGLTRQRESTAAAESAPDLSQAHATRVYNAASSLMAAGHGSEAGLLFGALLSASSRFPDLAGRIHYKLALLEADRESRTGLLQACLRLLPSHRAAKALLDSRSGALET